MSLLSDRKIIQEIEKGNIFIEGFNKEKELRLYNNSNDGSYKGKLGPNGYDLTLNNKLYVYTNEVLDCKKDNNIKEIIIPEDGYTLQPNILYIGCVNEYTKTKNYVPALEGRSSLARLGLSIHQTSGFGDDGFEGRFTCEFTVVHPLVIYPNMRICQIVYHKTEGEVINRYQGKYQYSETPVKSRMYQDNEFNKNNIEIEEVKEPTKNEKVVELVSLIDGKKNKIDIYDLLSKGIVMENESKINVVMYDSDVYRLDDIMKMWLEINKQEGIQNILSSVGNVSQEEINNYISSKKGNNVQQEIDKSYNYKIKEWGFILEHQVDIINKKICELYYNNANINILNNFITINNINFNIFTIIDKITSKLFNYVDENKTIYITLEDNDNKLTVPVELIYKKLVNYNYYLANILYMKL